jgi:hypothetical protein
MTGAKPAMSLRLDFGLRHHIVVGYQQHKYRNAQKVGEEAQIRVVDHLHSIPDHLYNSTVKQKSIH